MMPRIAWRWAERLSGLLKPAERETLLGDLEEAGETGWRALASVGGVVFRREAVLWRNWRPWLAAFGIALPSTFLLEGFSLSIASGFTVARPGLLLFLCNIGLLAGWAWTGGFAVGSTSRRTVWASAALSVFACSFCLARFRVESMSRFCLLLFLPAAVWGVWCGFRASRVRLEPALVLALIVTALTIPGWGKPGAWLPNWALSWPAWYLVAVAIRPRLGGTLHGQS